MEAYCIDRHYKLWEDNNKLLKRVVFVTVAISLALIVKVLIPFVEDSESKKPVIQKIEALEKDKNAVIRKIKIIEETESVLRDVNKYIARQPWQKEKIELIQRYRRMRNSAPSGYQVVADNTIRKISKMLRNSIVKPLQHSIRVTDERRRDLARLNSKIAALQKFIRDWERRYIGKNWYRTIRLKEMAMMGLRDDLNRRLQEFSTVVDNELRAVKQARESVNNELKSLNNSIVTESDKLKDLEEELQKILPQWMRGLVKTEQVIQLLPVFLLGVVFYVFVIGVGLTRHFRIYADGKGLKEKEIADPVMSSIWTLIPRGRYGSLQVVIAYSLFFLAAWLLLEEAMDLLLDWLSIDPSRAWVGTRGPWQAFMWLSRGCFLFIIVYVCIMPMRKTGK